MYPAFQELTPTNNNKPVPEVPDALAGGYDPPAASVVVAAPAAATTEYQTAVAVPDDYHTKKEVVQAIPVDVSGSGLSVIRPDVVTYGFPEDVDTCFKASWFVGSVIWCAIAAVLVFVWMSVVPWNAPVKGFCSTSEEMDEHLCIFAVGQMAKGIITIGQITVGVINISQCGIGLLFAVGQAQGGLGLSVGMVAVGSYIPAAQLAVASVMVKYAQLGFQFLAPLRHVNGEHTPIFVSCHCSGNRRRRRHRRM